MLTTEELNTTFQKVGNDFGFKNVEAEFAPFRDVKIKWFRTSNHARFSVSDYLTTAPAGVVEDIVTGLMQRMHGEKFDGYSSETVGWMTSHSFRTENQGKYIERSRSLDIDTEGTERLWGSYHRLVSEGMVPEIEDLRMFWSKGENVAKAGQSSCLMRVVIMNRRLLDSKIPSEILDYCILYELLNVIMPFGMDNIERKKEVTTQANGFEGADIAKRWLDQVMMEV